MNASRGVRRKKLARFTLPYLEFYHSPITLLGQYVGRSPLVRTSRPDRYIQEQNSVVRKICPACRISQCINIILCYRGFWQKSREKGSFRIQNHRTGWPVLTDSKRRS